MTLQTGICLGLWLFVMASTGIGTWLSLRFLRQRRPRFAAVFERARVEGIEGFLPPVSVIKPMKSVDDGLRQSLEVFLTQDYPDYELIFCVASEDDPAFGLARDLIEQYPHSKARLLVGEAGVGFNPKVDNLLKGYQQAEHDWILISDSNVRVGSDYLKKLVSHVGPGVGLVTSPLVGLHSSRFWGHVERIALNSFVTRWTLFACALGVPVPSGKVMLFQRSVAEQFGGLSSLANYLAEDFMLADKMRRIGLKVVLTHEPVVQYVGEQSVFSYWGRHLRWGRLRKAISIYSFISEILINSIVSGVLGGWVIGRWLGVSAGSFFAFHMSFYLICDLLLIQEIEGSFVWQDLIAWCVREASAIPLWLVALCGNKVKWRGKELIVRAQTRLELPGEGSLSEHLETSFSMGSGHQ
jgi:ceramide glucosyltransferase